MRKYLKPWLKKVLSNPLECVAFSNMAIDDFVELSKSFRQFGWIPPVSPIPVMAAQYGSDQCLAMLAQLGADFSQPDIWGAPPIWHAVTCGHIATVTELANLGVDLNEYLVIASDFYQVLLACGEFPLLEGTPLMHAAWLGNVEMAQALIALGAKADCPPGSPLAVAAQRGHIDIIRVLANSNVNILNQKYQTKQPLYYAALSGSARVVKAMMELGAKVISQDIVEEEEINPFLGQYDHPLTRYGAASSLLAPDEQQRYIDRILLIRWATPLNPIDLGFDKEVYPLGTPETPLHVAATLGNLELVHLFISEGIPVDGNNTSKATPLHAAAANGHAPIIATLKQAGANLNTPTSYKEEDGITPLYMAIIFGHYSAVCILLQLGANIHLVTSKGNTPLHIACKKGAPDIVKQLINHGADVNASNNKDRDPLFYAYKYKHPLVVPILLAPYASTTVYSFHDDDESESAQNSDNANDCQQQ